MDEKKELRYYHLVGQAEIPKPCPTCGCVRCGDIAEMEYVDIDDAVCIEAYITDEQADDEGSIYELLVEMLFGDREWEWRDENLTATLITQVEYKAHENKHPEIKGEWGAL